jgi:ABC-2 type transport system ATP-binding protein
MQIRGSFNIKSPEQLTAQSDAAEDAKPIALVVQGLRKRYGTTEAVAGIDFKVDAGEVFGLLGANGAGKTTTLSMLATEITPTEGDAMLFGHSVRREPQFVRAMLGIVPQGLAIYPMLTAAENLRFFGRIYGIESRTLDNSVREALNFVGLERQRNKTADIMSGGMRRRLNLAIALVHRPRLILLDEATLGVDPNVREHIFEIVRGLRDAGAAIVYTTHYMEEAERLCDRIGIMNEGKLVATGNLAELLSSMDCAEIIEVYGLPPETDVVAALGHDGIRKVERSAHSTRLFVTSAAAFLEPLAHIIARSRRSVRLKIEPVGLDSVFRSLTGRGLSD